MPQGPKARKSGNRPGSPRSRIRPRGVRTTAAAGAHPALTSGQAANAQSERSDVTAVPAVGVVAEAMTAVALADAMLEKFGGDSLGEMRRNVDGYLAALAARRQGP